MRWEVRRVTCYKDYVSPEDWEPFAAAGDDLWLRRRVVPVETKPLPAGVLSAKELAQRRHITTMNEQAQRAYYRVLGE